MRTPKLPKLRFRIWILFLLMILVADYASKKIYFDSFSRDVLVLSRNQLTEGTIFLIPFLAYVSFEHTDDKEMWDDEGSLETRVLSVGIFGNYIELYRSESVISFGNL